ILRGLLHFLQDHRTDLLRRVRPVTHLYLGHATLAAHHFVGHPCNFLRILLIGVAHEALDGVDGVPRVGDRLTLGRVADLPFTVLHESHNAGSGALSFTVIDHHRLVALHNGDATVGGTKVDTNDLAHFRLLFIRPA